MIKRTALLSLVVVFVFANTSSAYRGFYSEKGEKVKEEVQEVENVSDYTGKHHPITTRLGVKGQREAKKRDDNHNGNGNGESLSYKSMDRHDGLVKRAIHYPTGQRSSSAITLEKHFPAKAQVGKEFSYLIKVTNLTDNKLENVKVSEVIPNNFKIISSDPAVSSKVAGKAVWKIGSLKPGESVVIDVSGKASDNKSAPCCAEVDYDVPALCHTTDLEQPAVVLELKAPSEKLQCDLIDLEYTVKNTGDSYLEDLVVTGKLPEGVTTSKGADSFEFTVPGLAAGESETVRLLVSAEEKGQYKFSGKVANDSVSDSSPVRYTKVVKPNVTVDIKAQKTQQYLGRDVKYMITVKNTSSVDAESTMVVAEIPENAAFKGASDNGRLVEDIVGWEVGNLKAYESKTLELTLNALGAGTSKTKVGVQAECCEPSTDTASTSLVGIPALLLEVVDLVDPIEIGEEQTYVVKVTNQGTADANDVKIVALLDGMDHISDSGETRGSMDTYSNMLSFSPISALGPKDSASWEIKVKGNKEGDLRFTVSLTSNELTKPVEEAESTFVY